MNSPAFTSINETINEYAAHQLSDLKTAALMDRVDTKYLLPTAMATNILQSMLPYYSILEIDGARLFNYQNTYFDTPDYLFYHMHHRGKLSLPELVLLHTLICVSAIACETTILSSGWKEQLIQYEKIDNIKPERRQELITDLCLRTGLAVKDVSIVEIDFLRDTAQLRVYYTESCGIYSASGNLGLPNTAALADTNETLRFRAK
ncbi:MAG: DUF4956 domain-containing protein [Hahellaceae bacterium]|nr:DUF4956 domain-containing protein [Hahellaceae bacterium]MCP5210355.1 DUF4956 domain-containing protein [Hahellaceae bacterium]